MVSYPCTDDPNEIIESIVEATDNADKFDKFVNGGVLEEVQLGFGQPTPTIRNLVHLVKSAAAVLDGSDVSGKFSDAANGGTVLRTLTDHFSDFINVKDFGAIGDGVADDTAAIKAAISNASLGCLLFPKGVYCISDTLTMTGNANGAYWFFGESHLKWIGAEAGENYASYKSEIPSSLTEAQADAAEYNIDTYGWAWYAKPMIYIAPASEGTWSRCIIDGGNFDGNGKASMAIKVGAFASLVRGVRIGHVKHCGIALCGDNPWEAGSGGVMLSN